MLPGWLHAPKNVWVWRWERCMVFSFAVRQMFQWSPRDSVAMSIQVFVVSAAAVQVNALQFLYSSPVVNYTDFADPSTRVPLAPGIRRICLKLWGGWIQLISGSGMGKWSVPSRSSSGAVSVSFLSLWPFLCRGVSSRIDQAFCSSLSLKLLAIFNCLSPLLHSQYKP